MSFPPTSNALSHPWIPRPGRGQQRDGELGEVGSGGADKGPHIRTAVSTMNYEPEQNQLIKGQ